MGDEKEAVIVSGKSHYMGHFIYRELVSNRIEPAGVLFYHMAFRYVMMGLNWSHPYFSLVGGW